MTLKIALLKLKPWDARDIYRFGLGLTPEDCHIITLSANEKIPEDCDHVVIFSQPVDEIVKSINRSEVPYSFAIVNSIPLKQSTHENFISRTRLHLALRKIRRRAEFMFSVNPQRAHDYNLPQIKIHCTDYEVFLRAGFKPDHSSGFIFIDQAIGDDPEVRMFGHPDIRDQQEYRKRTCMFLERNFKSFTIAAHPRTSNGLFWKYQMVHNSTQKLISGSSGVIAHYSTAINFAILYKKPIFLLRVPDFPYVDRYINGWGEELNIPVSDYRDTVSEFPGMDNYENYRRKYIASDGDKTPMIRQIVNAIKRRQ